MCSRAPCYFRAALAALYRMLHEVAASERVVKVDLLSGKAFREPGASYRCHLSGGKHSCIEKDIEIIPLQKIVTVLPEDTFGVSKILRDYMVETTFQALGPWSTSVAISHYYSTKTLKAKLLNLIANGKIAHETRH